MKFDENQMMRQIKYEAVLHWLTILHDNGVLTDSEYRSEKACTDAPIKHLTLYYKKNKSN
ncbi:MAG: hypothetical protein ACI4NM_05225 [Bullifex sp.]